MSETIRSGGGFSTRKDLVFDHGDVAITMVDSGVAYTAQEETGRCRESTRTDVHIIHIVLDGSVANLLGHSAGASQDFVVVEHATPLERKMK